MNTTTHEIRTLIERWAAAIHAGDLDTVLADHADGIVMYDVPPPYEGVRGIDAYRQTWPPFFAWQRSGAVFELESLDVVAGADVAFAYALLRCGTPEDLANNPANRLRLTLGLRKDNDRWVVAHEHHSFPLAPGAAEAEVRQVHETWFEQTTANDLDGMMESIADDVVSYEDAPPLQYVGIDSVREFCSRGLEAGGDARIEFDVPDLQVLAREDLAVSWGLDRIRTGDSERWERATRVFERRNGQWVMVHQHRSVPYEPETGIARTDLTPQV